MTPLAQLLFALTLVLSRVLAAPAPAAARLETRSISQSLMDDFERFVQFASGAYQLFCPAPLGTTLITQFNDDATNTQGYIARDDANAQIIVAYRGSIQLQDFVTDLEFALVPFTSPAPSVTSPSGVQVHQGFLDAFSSVSPTVLSTVSAQLAAHPTYTLISVGHSLGAALASLGGVALGVAFPDQPLKVYTFGQPRTGNKAYADWVESVVGVGNLFRGVETFDGVPTIPPLEWGYQHHGTQYWVFQDPNTDPANVKQCVGQEDPTCSDSIPSTGINVAHLTYFGQLIALNPVVCL